MVWLIVSAGAFGGASAQSGTADGAWTRMIQIPDISSGWSMFDSARDRLVAVEIKRTWAMDPNDVSWSVLAEPELSTATPGARGIYDVAHDRALVIDEVSFPPQENFVSQYSFSGAPGWHYVSTSGDKLHYRTGFSVILDQARDRVLVFGGVQYIYGSHGQIVGFTYYNDLRALSLTTFAWTMLGTSGIPPTPRASHAAAYDPVQNRMVVFGGTNDTDVWSLDLATMTWSHTMTTAGPSPSSGNTMAYDPGSDRMLLFGGAGQNELWELPLPEMTSWNLLAPAGGMPSPPYAADLLRDPTRNIFWVRYPERDYVWSLDVSGTPVWTNRSVPLPPSCWGCVAAYDSDHDALIVNDIGDSGNEMWSLALGSVPAWTDITPTGTRPPARRYHSGIFDPDGHRLVIWGGSLGATNLNDLWQLDLAGAPTWTQLAAAGTPPSARSEQATAFDPLRRRMLVFGGYDNTPRNDVWQLSLESTPTWTLLAPSGTPPGAQAGAQALYDVARERLLIVDELNPGKVWALSAPPSPQWTLLPTSDSALLPGYWNHPVAILDPVRDRLVVKYQGSQWALPLSGLEWAMLTPTGDAPSWSGVPAAVYDPGHDRMLLRHGVMTDALNWASTTGVDPRPNVRTMLGPCSPNPAREALSIPFALTQRSHVEIVVHDLVGRLVRTPFRGDAEAGEHVVRWDLRTQRGDHVGPGVYFCSMHAGAATASRRIVVVP